MNFIDKLKSINPFIIDTTEKINKMKNKEINNLTNKLEQKIEKEYNKLIQIKDNAKNTLNNTFDSFENKLVKPMEDKICGTASDIENKLINVVQNLDEQTEKYLQKIFPNDIDSKIFSFIKNKKDNLLNKLDNEELKTGISRFCNSNFINKSRNIIDKIDLNKAKTIINDISSISNYLKLTNKYEFRDNIKSKIRDKILRLYSTKIEIELRDFLNKTCRKLINKI